MLSGIPRESLCLLLWALLVQCLTLTTLGYYVPGTYPQEFRRGQSIQPQVSTLTSYETELPFEYYSLPFCQPPDGLKRFKANVNPGTILLGLRVENSVYNFSVMVPEPSKIVCTRNMTKKEARDLEDKVDKEYRINMLLDNLPITTNDLTKVDFVRPGFPIGFKYEGKYCINNHLHFIIDVHPSHGEYSNDADQEIGLVVADSVGRRRLLKTGSELMQSRESNGDGMFASHKEPLQSNAGGVLNKQQLSLENSLFMIVGFQVVPFSTKHNEDEKVDLGALYEDLVHGKTDFFEEIGPDKEIVYTYSVQWNVSSVGWASRWDAYLRTPGGKVHWFSILNSILVVIVMAVVCAMILIRTVRRDLAKYEELLMDGGSSAADLKEEAGWKMVSGDVFRAPRNPIRLAVRVGSGIQINCTCGVTLLFAVVGFLSPASRGSLLTALLVLYLLLAIVAGFAGVWLWGCMTGLYEGWRAVCWRVGTYFPGITFLVLTILNLAIKHTGSTGAIPASTYFSILFLWFLISVPLTFVGGYMATRVALPSFPVRTNQLSRHIPTPPLATNPWVLFLAAGALPFGTLFLELYFVMSSMWMGFYYYLFGYLAIILILTIIITIEVSILCTYVQLCTEDYLWWWRSFNRGGVIALYLMVYALVFLWTTLHSLAGSLSVLLYLSYMSILVWGVYLAMGTIGFLSSFAFTYAIFSSVKLD